MVSREFICIIVGLGLASGLALAAESPQPGDIVAPIAAESFSRLGIEIVSSNPENVDAAMAFLQAGMLLDKQSGTGYEQFLRGAGRTCQGQQNYREIIQQTLKQYLDYKADLDIASQSLACVIEQVNSRQEREAILMRLLSPFASANPIFGSDIAVQLGLYAVERADIASAVKQFEYAVQLNPYHVLAQAKLMELRRSQTANGEWTEKLNWLRLKLAVNPMDLQAAVEFGQAAYQAGLYQPAVNAFEYASNLYEFIHPGAVMHEEIAIGWAESCYFSSPHVSRCQAIADKLRQAGVFNLEVEVVAALAAETAGNSELKNKILSEAASKAESQFETNQPTMSAHQLGLFYCFAAESSEKALAWCNAAYKQDPNAAGCKSLMAYAFWLNQQEELAEEYASPLAENDPVAMLTLAQILIKKDQKQKAAELLNKAASRYLSLPIALKVKDLRKQLGIEGISEVSPELIQQALAARWGEKVIPSFATPDKLFKVKLKFEGEEFFYGNELDAWLVVENTSVIPLIIGPQSLVTGHYRVDAEIRGDIVMKAPQLLEKTFRPGKVLLPGEAIATRLNLNTGSLAKALFSYPQAAMTIDFKLYLDPVSDTDGSLKSGIPGQGVIQSTVRRKKVELTREFLVQRLDSLAKGQEGQKLRAAELFAGLYAEQLENNAGRVPYKHIFVESALLTDSIRRSILDENWRVQVHILTLLARYSVNLDYTMTESVSDALNHEKWPERMIAMWLLGQQQKATFQPVLDWKAEYDPFLLMRQLAVAMGGKPKAAEQSATVSELKP